MLNAQDNEMLCRVGPGTPMGELLRRFWVPVLRSEDLPEPDCDPVELRVFGEDYMAFRDTNGRIGILEALCPHRRAPLFYGRNEECGLRCIYHGWKFDVEGNCVDMPSEPVQYEFSKKVRPIGFPTEEWGGVIWGYFGPADKKPELPQVEWFRVPPSHRYIAKYNQECNFVQATEGDIDSSHIGFLHQELGSGMQQVSGEYKYWLSDRSPRWIIKSTDYGIMLAAQRNAEEDSHYWRINQWLMPFYTMIAMQVDQSRGHGHMWVPVDDEHTDVWCVTWSPVEPLTEEEKYSILSGPDAHISSLDPKKGKLKATKANHFLQDRTLQRTSSFTGIFGTREQDTAVVEGMGPVADRTREHLGTSDSAIIAMRRYLLNSAKAFMDGQEPQEAYNGDLYQVRAWSYVLPRQADFLQDDKVKELMVAMA